MCSSVTYHAHQRLRSCGVQQADASDAESPLQDWQQNVVVDSIEGTTEIDARGAACDRRRASWTSLQRHDSLDVKVRLEMVDTS